MAYAFDVSFHTPRSSKSTRSWRTQSPKIRIRRRSRRASDQRHVFRPGQAVKATGSSTGMGWRRTNSWPTWGCHHDSCIITPWTVRKTSEVTGVVLRTESDAVYTSDLCVRPSRTTQKQREGVAGRWMRANRRRIRLWGSAATKRSVFGRKGLSSILTGLAKVARRDTPVASRGMLLNLRGNFRLDDIEDIAWCWFQPTEGTTDAGLEDNDC